MLQKLNTQRNEKLMNKPIGSLHKNKICALEEGSRHGAGFSKILPWRDTNRFLTLKLEIQAENQAINLLLTIKSRFVQVQIVVSKYALSFVNELVIVDE